MKLLLFTLSIGFAGHRVSDWMWARFAAGVERNRYERAVSSALIAIFLWMAIAWALAIPRQMTGVTLLAGAAFALVVALFLRGGAQNVERPGPSAILLIAVVPLLLWTAFLLWRGYVTPPFGPDTLTYHMPRALLLSQADGYAQLPIPERRVNTFPANYELLVATIISLQRTATIAEWLTTAFLIVFLLQTCALAARWWRDGPEVAATLLVVASAPVLILNSAVLKNDLAANVFVLGALHWGGRWRSTHAPPAAVLAIASLAAAIGTKPQALALVPLAILFLAPSMIGAVRRKTLLLRRVAALIALMVVSAILLGGEHYAVIYGTARQAGTMIEKVAIVGYGEWMNVIEIPLLTLIAPFSPRMSEVPVPWRGEWLLWGRYDSFSSHFGMLVSLLALAAPFCAWRWGRDGNDERLWVTALGIAFAVAAMPAVMVPHGYLASNFDRYMLYLLPLIVAWVVPPVIRRLPHRGAAPLLAMGCAVLFASNAISATKYDVWAPFSSVRWAASHRETSWLPNEAKRSAFFVDAVAGPRDAIDMHAGNDSWTYPAWGRLFGRDVRFIDDASRVRPGTNWVVIDRMENVLWGHPLFTSTAQWRQYMGRGALTADDVRVFNQLRADPQWELVFYYPRLMQAVFHRRAAPRAILRRP